jgi:ferredoxin/flavodoxin
MAQDDADVLTVYFSPAGATRHVAEVIEAQFQTLGAKTAKFNLVEQKDLASLISEQVQNSKGHICLFIGSPVYVSHAVPPVMQFISELSESSGAFAVPFVTWGGASSGIALFEMGRELINKGYTIIGAAKVLAVHSLMWQLDSPLGQGHPNLEDDRMVQDLVIKVHKKIDSDNPKGIKLSRLAYQSKAHHAEMEQASLEVAKVHMPIREVDVTLCAQCQTCAEVCPTDAVTFSPYPEFGKSCIFCFNCMKNCPEQAIKADLSELWQRIRERADYFNERSDTQIFFENSF